MNDYKLENRKRQFENHSFNLTKAAEEASLTLRKNKLNKLLLEKRVNGHNNNILSSQLEDTISLEVTPESLSIPKEHILTIECLDDSISRLHNYLTSNNQDYIKAGLYSFRNYFIGSIEVNSMKLLSQYKIIDIFAFILQTNRDITVQVSQYELLWILINFLASDATNNEMILPLFTNESLEALNLLLASELCSIVENCLWVLAGLSSRSDEYRNILIQHPLYQTTLDLLQAENIDASIISQGLEFLSQCVLRVDYVKNRERIITTLKVFAKNIYFSLTIQTSLKGISAISYLNCVTYEISDVILNSGVIIKILKMKYQKDNSLLLPSIQILAAVMYTTDNQIQQVLNMHLLDFFDYILDHYANYHIEYYITSGLTNIAASKKKIKLALLNSALFDKVMLLLDKPYEKTRSNVIKILLNIVTSANYELTSIVGVKGIIQKLIDKSPETTKEQQIDILKIVSYYLDSFKNRDKNSTFVIILEQFKSLVENNQMLLPNEAEEILNYNYDFQ